MITCRPWVSFPGETKVMEIRENMVDACKSLRSFLVKRIRYITPRNSGE